MGIAEQLEGRVLTGTRKGPAGTPREWTVVSRLEAANDVTPGQYSVGYRAVSPDGKEAFVKASDLNLLTENDADLLERIGAAVRAHTFERNVLDYCQGSNMDRVVTALDYGQSRCDVDGQLDVLFFLIFELADGDIRKRVRESAKTDLIWAFSALHHLAVGVQQLHQGGVCHNDIKPANFLVFDDQLQKLADLGRATSNALPAIHDAKHDVGDPAYAAPEILYAHSSSACAALCEWEARRASDLYQLGSIAWYIFSGRMPTPEVVAHLAIPHRPPLLGPGWQGDFLGVLPYWRQSASRAVEDQLDPGLKAAFAGARAGLIGSVKEAILQLVEPDPQLRGHPLNRIGSQDPFGVERYIAFFDLVRRDLLVRS